MKKTFLIISAIALTVILTSGKIKTTTMEQPEDKPTIYYVLFHSPGAKWVSSLSFQEQPGVMDHVNYMAGFLESKKLVEGGPFLDNSGGMMVFNGTKEEAEKIANADPAVKAGLLKVVVRPWMVAMSSK
ncbi:MAG: cytosolic protein [Bacteroidota bacterium]|nr:cytosolic protein [Bacteroidota bacterium]